MLQISNDLSNYTFVRNKLSKEMRSLLPSRKQMQTVSRKEGTVVNKVSAKAQQDLVNAINDYLQLGRGRQSIQKYPYVKTAEELLLEKALNDPEITSEQRTRISAALVKMRTLPDAARGTVSSTIQNIGNRVHNQDWYAIRNYVDGDLAGEFDIDRLEQGDLQVAVEAILAGEMTPDEGTKKKIFDKYLEEHPEAAEEDEDGSITINTNVPTTLDNATEIADNILRLYGDSKAIRAMYSKPRESVVLDHIKRKREKK